MNTEYIYLLQEREFIKTNENIFKIGKTKQKHNDRLKQYPKGSILLLQVICTDCLVTERELISIFKTKYIHRKDIGNEYFEGDYKDMMDVIFENIKNNKPKIDEKIEQNDDCDKQYFIKAFIDEHIVIDKMGSFCKSELICIFSTWCRKSIEYNMKPSRYELFDYIDKTFGSYNREIHRWFGIKLINE